MSINTFIKRFGLFFIVTFLTFSLSLRAQAPHESRTLQIQWDEMGPNVLQTDPFESAEYHDGLPYTSKVIQLSRDPKEVKVEPSFEFQRSHPGLPDSITNKLAKNYKVEHKVSYARKKPYLTVWIMPIKKGGNGFQFLQTAQIKIKYKSSRSKKGSAKLSSSKWPTSSPLADGQWHRIGVDTTSIFKLTYEDLQSLGVEVTNLDPQHLHLYGNGGGELPPNNDNDHPKGLKQTPILIKAGNDGSMDKGDYLLFYGKGAHGWSYKRSGDKFRHNYHPYSNKSFYFLTVDAKKQPNRVQKRASLNQADYTTQTFNQLLFHEQDKLTAINQDIRSGRSWFGEVFSQQNPTRRFHFNFTSRPRKATLRYRFANHGTSNGLFGIKANGRQLTRESVSGTDPGYTAPFARVKQGSLRFPSDTRDVTFTINYNSSFDNKGWLDYLAASARTDLRYHGSPLIFQDKKASDKASVKFELRGINPDVKVWDITSTQTVHQQTLQTSGDTYTFTDSGNQVRRYLAFNPENAREPSLKGEVENQNLHGLPQADMLIVTHPRFKAQAQELADFHRKVDGHKVHVVTPQAIYNEFSSGKQDITAIRWFAKMFYDRANSQSEQPKYLVLFGDASFDYKDRISDNTNLVPTYQTRNSTAPLSSYSTDDYFGYLDDNEGSLDKINRGNFNDLLDISIGRMPVTTKEQAQNVVDKVKRYYRNKKRFGSWRNRVTFVADDMDDPTGWEDIFVLDSEEFSSTLNKEVPSFNMDKIYMDAYEQKTASGGKRYPAVNEAITNQINDGSLVINYMGHGGERGLANEKVVTFDDIKNWEGPNKMPLFVTATCEFTRYDDPGLLSAGERAYLKPDGGAIALLSTTRLVYADANTNLTRQVFENNMFQKVDGEHKTIGEVFLNAKNDFDRNVGGRDMVNARKFAMIGDPALKLAYPKYEVVTTEINSQPVSNKDSLKALQKVTLKGEVQNANGNRLKDFNGKVFPTIYDKKTQRQTLANDPAARKLKFKLLNSVIYDGQTRVNKGQFTTRFVVPKDISYEFGKGKISYYATNNETDAHGYNRIIVGGTADSPVTDTRPPKVDLFLNSPAFKDGGITSPDPMVLAEIQDDNGINTAANGIGHLPKLTIDGKKSVTLDDAYQASLDTFNEGRLRHQLMDLEPGKHYLQLKVWDVTNKVGSDQLSFVVVKDQQLTIESLTNYPNPFSDQTTIAFEHNQRGKAVKAQVRIYDIQGQTITRFQRQFSPEASRQTIIWNGTSANGQPLEPGVYICEVVLKADDGATVQESNRLVIQK